VDEEMKHLRWAWEHHWSLTFGAFAFYLLATNFEAITCFALSLGMLWLSWNGGVKEP
jgi:hypothetical protein